MKENAFRISLIVLQFFIGITAVIPGIMFFMDTTGSLVGMSLDVLKGSPFPNYFIPACCLTFIIGGGHLAAGILGIIRHRYYHFAGMFTGGYLMVWIAVQVASIGYLFFLQPMYFVMGFIELLLGKALWKRD